MAIEVPVPLRERRLERLQRLADPLVRLLEKHVDDRLLLLLEPLVDRLELLPSHPPEVLPIQRNRPIPFSLRRPDELHAPRSEMPVQHLHHVRHRPPCIVHPFTCRHIHSHRLQRFHRPVSVVAILFIRRSARRKGCVAELFPLRLPLNPACSSSAPLHSVARFPDCPTPSAPSP